MSLCRVDTNTQLSEEGQYSSRAVLRYMGRACMGITTSPWLYASVLRTSPESKRVEPMQLQAAGKRILTSSIIYAPSSSSDHITLSRRSLWVGPRKGYQLGRLLFCSGTFMKAMAGKPGEVLLEGMAYLI